MKLESILNNPTLKKGLKIVPAVIVGAVSAYNAFADQKKEAEFKEIKETIKKLQSKE